MIEDQPHICEVLTKYLCAQPGFEGVLIAGSVEEFLPRGQEGAWASPRRAPAPTRPLSATTARPAAQTIIKAIAELVLRSKDLAAVGRFDNYRPKVTD